MPAAEPPDTLIAFERPHVDNDFQDGAYEVRIPAQILVPEPTTLATLAAGLCLLGWTSLRRMKRD